jgi:hypothetical protein
MWPATIASPLGSTVTARAPPMLALKRPTILPLPAKLASSVPEAE